MITTKKINIKSEELINKKKTTNAVAFFESWMLYNGYGKADKSQYADQTKHANGYIPC